jgi:hypothetical protein
MDFYIFGKLKDSIDITEKKIALDEKNIPPP